MRTPVVRRWTARAGLLAVLPIVAVAALAAPAKAVVGPVAAVPVPVSVNAAANVTAAANAAPLTTPAVVPQCPICIGIGVGCAIFSGVCADAVDFVISGAGDALGAIANSVLEPIAEAIAGAAAELISNGLSWWMDMPTVDVAGTGIAALNEPLALLGAGIAMLLLIWQAIRAMISRRGAPLGEALEGLIKGAVVVALATTVVGQLAAAADGLTDLIARAAFCGGNASCNVRDGMTETVKSVLLPVSSQIGFVILTALVVFLVAIVQLVMLFIRQIAVPIPMTLTPVAAAGQIGGQTPRSWLPKLAAAVIAVIVYKPLAMLIIAVGFTQWEFGQSTADWIRGIMTLLLSVVALPTLMRIFTPLTSMGGAGGGGLSAGLSLLSTGLWAKTALGGGGAARSPSEVANQTAQTGPASVPPPAAPPPAAGAAAPAATTAAAPTAAAPAAGAAGAGGAGAAGAAGAGGAGVAAGTAAGGPVGAAVAGVVVAAVTAAAIGKEAVDRAANTVVEPAEANR